jgi:hypothetical protein
MKIYQAAHAQLHPHERHRLKRKGRKPFKIPDLEAYLELIAAHWAEQRRLCENNPDYFNWPSTEVWVGNGNFWVTGLDDEGVLKLFGYAVSKEFDLSDEQRRHQLDLVFSVIIPPFTRLQKIAEWGEPKSAPRLRKMANCLANFARNGARRDESYMEVAVEKWVDDLSYLYRVYYRDKFGFAWPDAF